MKKFVKMSLVAALAVAGTTASAQPLAEAIQNVDISGTVVYRYDDRGNDNNAGAGDGANNNYKVGVSLTSKVNDDVTFNARIIAGSNVADDTGIANNANNFGTLDTSANSDDNLSFTLSTANFTYSGIANTSITVGKQGLATPWTNAIDSDGSEQTGTGILAATTMGPVTAAAGYFNQTNITGSALNGTGTGEDLMVAGLMAKFGIVNVEAWYLDHQDDFDSMYYGANASFDLDGLKLGLDAKYTTVDVDGLNADLGNYEVGITAKMGIFNAGVAYAETDTDGSGILNALAKNGQTGYSVDIAGTDNAEMMTYYASAQITPELNVMVRYDDIEDQDAGAADDHSELWTQITYNMSKNLSTYVRFADGEDANVDYKRGRLQVEYKF